jgi:hypothetical protein
MGSNAHVRKAPVAMRTEWNEYTPEVIDAIRKGYLDDVASQIAYELETRRAVVARYGYYSQPKKAAAKPKRLVKKKG